MNYYYITGTSKGIGKAIAELLLQDGNNKVIGISRNSTINHQGYTHHKIDLSDLEVVEKFNFLDHADAGKLMLINNAGTISPVKYFGNQSAKNIKQCIDLNLTAPVILMNKFISAYENIDAEKLIVNISSGAASSPIDGWGVYCSAKAGLDMVSKVAQKEQGIIQNKHPIRILSIAPGIVDTPMQDEIREADIENFSRLNDFIDYKSNSDLISPAAIAIKLKRIIDDPKIVEDVLYSLREMAD